MQRSSSGSIKSGTSGGGGKKSNASSATKNWNLGFKRRNSTSVSSLKIKKAPAAGKTASAKSFEQSLSNGNSTQDLMAAQTQIVIEENSGDNAGSDSGLERIQETRLSASDDASSGNEREGEGVEEVKSENEEDLLAELNQN